MEAIRSLKEAPIVLARAVKTRQGRQTHHQLLLEGEEILAWAIEYAIPIEYLLVSERAAAVAARYEAQGYTVYTTSEGILKKVSDTSYLIPVLGVARMPALEWREWPAFTVVLDGVQDLGNLGTIIRTCQAFGIRQIVSTTPDLDLHQRKTIEASRGSVFATQVARFPDAATTLAQLKRQGYQIVATSPRGAHLQSLVTLRQQPVALVIGNETAGVAPEFEHQADFLVQIPMAPAVESLNVGVATGISLYELKLKQVLAMIEQQIKSTLGRELNVAGMLVQRALDVALRQVSELSSQQVIWMMVLKCDGTMRVEDLCRQFGLLESEVPAFLAPLVRSGWVKAEGDLTLTVQGEEALAKLWFVVENTERRILAGFTDTQVQTLLAQLRQIQETCIHLMAGDQ